MDESRFVLKIYNKTGESFELDSVSLTEMAEGIVNSYAEMSGVVPLEANVIFFPDNYAGSCAEWMFHQITTQIEQCPLRPATQEEQFWWAYVNRFWECRGLLWAWRLFGAIPDPFQPGEPLSDCSPKESDWWKRLGEVDNALYELIKVGFEPIKVFLEKKQKLVPRSPFDLMVEIAKEWISFHLLQSEGSPWNPIPQWRSKPPTSPSLAKLKRQQYLEFRSFLYARIDEPAKERKFCEVLIQQGLDGCVLVALSGMQREYLKARQNYCRALSDLYTIDKSWNTLRFDGSKFFQKQKSQTRSFATRIEGLNVKKP